MELRPQRQQPTDPDAVVAWSPALTALTVLIVVAGLVLRFHDAGSALLGPDELHAPRVARTTSYLEMFTRYENTDNSVPYSLYTRALMDADALTETTYRLPAMLSAALLLLAPLWFRRRLGASATLVALALVAGDPLGVYFAIVARPYALTALALVLAFRSWLAFVDEDSGKGGWGFVMWGAFAVFLHLFSVFPLAVLGLHGIGRACVERLPWRPLCLRGVVLVGLVLAPLVPGLEGLVATRAAKVGVGELTWPFVADVWAALVAQVTVFGWILPVLLAAGGVAAWRRVQVLAVLATRPFGPPTAWARYLHLLWPIALMLAAQGLVAMIGLLRASPRVTACAAVVVGLGLAVFVPVSSSQAYFDAGPNPYRANDLYMLAVTYDPPSIPGSYLQVIADPERGDVLVECPDLENLTVKWVPMAHQRRHQMRIELAVDLVDEMRDSGIHLKHYIDVRDPDELVATGARYLVLYPLAQDTRMARKLRTECEHEPPDADGFQLFRLDRRLSP